jgi:endonuclease/exonuclease/phosphatase family metal-dependent hydrolase
MFSLIKDEKPDVLFIQEYHAGRKGKVNIADSIRKYSGLPYSHLSQVLKKGKPQPYGIATFSRWPIVSKGVIRFSSNPANVCIFTDIVHKKDTIRLFNIHLESIQFSREDYLFVNDLKNNADEQEKVTARLQSMARKLKSAFSTRTMQAQKVAVEIEKSPYPVIVSGDFNDTPSSYAYHRISHGLADAFIRSGRGISQTYAGPFPSFRIDYILYDQDRFAVSDYRKINQKYSDHLPVKARLYLLSDE